MCEQKPVRDPVRADRSSGRKRLGSRNFYLDSRPLGDHSKDNMADVEVVRVRHTCRECGKSYNKNSRLEEHIRSHTGEVSK